MNIDQIIEKLNHHQVVAYPTEAVFGLGCNPLNKKAVEHLLFLKQRPVEKGLILVAHHLDLLLPYIDQTQLTSKEFELLNKKNTIPTTWVVPSHQNTPKFITGKFNTIAIRVSQHDAIKTLCKRVGFALVSTSANLTGLPPCKSVEQVKQQFGDFFPIYEGEIGQASNPSQIKDIFTHKIIRN